MAIFIAKMTSGILFPAKICKWFNLSLNFVKSNQGKKPNNPKFNS